MRWAKVHILFIISILFSHFVWSQQAIQVELGQAVIEPSERFTIRVVIREKEYNVGDFPTIEGFTKAGKSVAHTPFKENGKKGIEHTIIQNYIPTALGTFRLPDFSLKINGVEQLIDGTVLRVVNDKTKLAEEDKTIKATKEDAMLAISVSHNEVFVGQGCKVTVAFYVSSQNTVGWDFPSNLNSQVDAIAKRLKPENCLESRLMITNVAKENTTLGGKSYDKYMVFQAIYYPLDTKSFTLPSVQMSMWRVNDKNVREVERMFSTKPTTVVVKSLPEHPLKDKVAVGNFKLQEWISKSKVETGTSFTCRFVISGEGNFTTVGLSMPPNDSHFDFYPPKTESKLITGSEIGERSFIFPVFPKDSGTFEMKNYFQWVYFNTKTATYDTLKPKLSIKVVGETITQAKASSANIYDGIEKLTTSSQSTDYRLIVKNIANVLILGVIIVLLFLFIKNKN